MMSKGGRAIAQGRPGPGGPGGGPGRPGGGRGGPACFLSGTRILTPLGEVPIETLKSGDTVVTMAGRSRRITKLDVAIYSRPADGRWSTELLPVRIKANAISDGFPATDLYLSQLHCVLIDGVLIPVGDLVNGTTISICDGRNRETIEYYHINLDTHDVLDVHGAPCETKLEIGQQEPCYPICRLTGAAMAVSSRLRSAFSPFTDRRQPFDRIRDRLEDRAEALQAA